MKCLIDADVLTYEIAFSSQFVNDEGELVIRDFEFASDLLDQRIKEIEDECWANEPSTLYLTNDETLHKMWKRHGKTHGYDVPDYKPNFRIELAKSAPYKGTRKQEKPFHRDNLRAYMLEHYDCKVANGMEADDLLAIDQTKAPHLTTVICTRDKDLRMVEGMHYGWPCGNQPTFGPEQVDRLGWLKYDEGKNKLTGVGLKFFYAQMIMGDKVDNIPGLPRGGPKLAYRLLDELESEEEMLNAVKGKYKEKLGDDYKDYFLEQARLLWMVTELDDNGQPVMWRF